MNSDIILTLFDSIPLWVMLVPIFICSVIAVAVIIERFIFFKKITEDYRLLLKKIISNIKDNKISEATTLSASVQGPIAKIIFSYVVNFKNDDKDIELEQDSEKAIRSVEKYIGVISTIATVAPMLGLLGTVTGMMKSFSGLATLEHAMRKELLAYGIAEALITTATGLLVAIPALIFYNYMVSKAEYYIKEIEFLANGLLDLKK